MKTPFLKLILLLVLMLAISNSKAQIIGDSTDILWEAPTTHLIRDLSFSPDSKFILTGHDDYVTRIWNVKDGSLFAEIPSQEQPVFSNDGKFIVSRKIYDIYLWNFPALDTYKIIKTPCFVFQVGFSNNDKTIASAEHNCGLFFWDFETGKTTDTIKDFSYKVDPKYGGSPQQTVLILHRCLTAW